MTDKKFQKVLDDLAKANENYKKLLTIAEDEIKNRFGYDPSEVDNDSWIDVYHVGTGRMTVKQVETTMKLHISTHRF
jgi:hypothetical protein